MKKSELIREVAARTGQSQSAVRDVLDGIVDVTKEALSSGDSVTLVGVASVSSVERPARVGRNPRTGEKVVIPGKRVVKIKAGAELEGAVN